MLEAVEEWIAKAEGDVDIARREFAREGNRNLDAICFHAHQCVEKLMKAALIAHGVVPDYTHNLAHLNACLKNVVASWETDVEELIWLTRAGITFRYPGEWATDLHVEKAMGICEQVREQLLNLFESK